MSKKKSPPKYLVIYRCEKCGQDSGFTERDKPSCRFCQRADALILISKQPITKEVITNRLKTVADRMLNNLQKAYEQLPEVGENIVSEGRDAEIEILRLLARVKKLRDNLHSLEKDESDKKDQE